MIGGAGRSATPLRPGWPGAGWLITLALTSQVLGWLLITISLPRLPAALTSLLLTIQPIGSVVLGAMIFGERPSPLQLLGVAVVLGAVIFATRRRVSGSDPRPFLKQSWVFGADMPRPGRPRRRGARRRESG